MIVLALDTSTRLGTVAVAADGEVLARAELGRQGTHASRLIPAIDEVLEEGGVDRDELRALVLGSGPGSFTGVRVAAATAKGMAHALNLPIYTFSSLAAAAASVDLQLARVSNARSDVRRADARYVLFDARADRLYAGCWLPTDHGLDELIAPHATTVETLLGSEIPLSVFCGDGAARHQDELRGAGYAVLPPQVGMPTADGLVRLFRSTPDARPLADPGAWEPLYLRETGAVRMAKRGSAPGPGTNDG